MNLHFWNYCWVLLAAEIRAARLEEFNWIQMVRCPRSVSFGVGMLGGIRNWRKPKLGGAVAVGRAIGGTLAKFAFWIVAVLFKVSSEIDSPFTGPQILM